MSTLNLVNSLASTIGQSASAFSKYKNKVDQAMDVYDNAQEQIIRQTSNANNFNLLAQDFNTLLWSNFNPTELDILGSSAENTINILGNTAGATINGIKSTGSPWGALMGLPVLASELGGYFSAKNNAKGKIQSIKENNERINNDLVNKFNYRASAISLNNLNNQLLNLKAFGGNLHMNDVFNNGVRFIEEGGSHEQNPLGGVPQGIAPDGLPNLVEEGEAIFNDYVYSKRLKVPNKDKEMLGLKQDKEYTFADAAGYIQRESEERPNDPLSKKNMEAMFARLLGSQEELKQKRDTQKMKKEFEKLSPEELAYMIQAMSQPQQTIPVQAQYAANGGHLFSGKEKGSNKLYKLNTDGWSYTKPETGPYVMNNGLYYALPEDFNAQEAWDNLTYDNEGGYWKVVTPTKSSKGFSGAQTLRAMPVVGSAIGALTSLFDKPNYSNIERTENMYRQIPMVSAKPIGNRMTYIPMDVNYLMTQIGNLNLGARRAIIENSAGNAGAAMAGLIALNYKGTTAMGEAFRQANEYNLKQRQLVDEFNKGTDMYNSESDFKSQVQNQARALQIADAFMKTGAMRDAELATVQTNKSNALSSFFNNMGNLGQDMLSREQVAALIKDGAYYNLGKGTGDLAKTNYGIINAFGGKLKKKGGKHA